MDCGSTYTKTEERRRKKIELVHKAKRKMLEPEDCTEETEGRKSENYGYVMDYFLHSEGVKLMQLHENRSDTGLKDEIKKIAFEKFVETGLPPSEAAAETENFSKTLFGYYVLDELIQDESISDIKCYSFDRVRVKRYGKREDSKVRFKDKEDYIRFINLVAAKNEVNISTINAIQKFTDYQSDSKFILRFNISTGYVNMSNMPCLHIRKIPKRKLNIKELTDKGFLTLKQAEYLKRCVTESSGILLAGKGASGKTTLLNALLDEIPADKSGLVIQESDELFSEHPDILFQHIKEGKGENKVNYTFKMLAANGLLIDLDYFIVGEIKGDEAADFFKACYTGHRCMTTVHGKSAQEAVYKLADYIKQATEYEMEDCLRMLCGIENVVFLKDWHIEEICRIKGFDAETKSLVYEGLVL